MSPSARSSDRVQQLAGRSRWLGLGFVSVRAPAVETFPVGVGVFAPSGRSGRRWRPRAASTTSPTGRGAFYGPKVAFDVEDATGREWTIGTVQLDFVQPEQVRGLPLGEDVPGHAEAVAGDSGRRTYVSRWCRATTPWSGASGRTTTTASRTWSSWAPTRSARPTRHP